MFKSIKTLTLFGMILFLPLMVSVVDPQSVMATVAVAEDKEKKEPKYKDVKTRKRQSVGVKCAKALERVQVAMEEERWDDSLTELNNIESSRKTCKKAYEQTQIWKFQAIVYFSKDDFSSAINSFRKVVDSEGTPEDLRLDTRYTLAQLYTAEERYTEAAIELEIWLDRSTFVNNDARALLAQIYYQLDRKKDSLRMLELAIADVESKGKLPKERWWSLQRVLYHEKNDYKKVISILENLVKHYPKWTYWKQIGSMYGVQERPIDQLVATELVYINGELDKESQVMGLAYMYLSAEVPYKAAQILAKGMEDGIVKQNAKNLELLGTSWTQAKDLISALKSMEAASKFSDSGDLQSNIADIYLNLGRDKEAYKASLKASKKGNLKYTDANYLSMGIALLNMHCYKDAITAFRKSLKAAKTKKRKRYPRQFIKYADAEGTRLGKLRDLGAKVPSCRK